MRLPFRTAKIERLDRYLAKGRYELALEAISNELNRDPYNFELLEQQARIREEMGDHGELIAAYRELATAYVRDGRHVRAIAVFKEILNVDPSLVGVDRELARLIKKKGPEPDDIPTAVEIVQAPPEERTEVAQERASSALFGLFEEEALEEVLATTCLRTFDSGQRVFEEGDRGASLFIILEGEARASTKQGDRTIRLADMGPGELFGEVAVLSGNPRAATVTALSRITAIELGKIQVDDIASRYPQVRAVLQRFCEERAELAIDALIRKRGRET